MKVGYSTDLRACSLDIIHICLHKKAQLSFIAGAAALLAELSFPDLRPTAVRLHGCKALWSPAVKLGIKGFFFFF